MFKQKTWTEVSRKYTPGKSDFKATGWLPSEIEKFAFGFTTIEMRCIETGELKFYEQIGDQR